MVSTVTTTTITTAAVGSAITLIAILALLIFLIYQEILSVSVNVNTRVTRRLLNLAIAPLLIVFAFVILVKIIEVLRP
ncbi:MAG TPA: hypothetical protein PLD25_29460 [Chloroflexota bacterium]|nr:hypothetical protein [Chloroflexota bacterium]HUM67386.1 hypothetical protein [Chloroflexota bacterium]